MNETFKYEIPKHIVANIITFLKKTPLIGEEVPAYNSIMAVLGNPIKEEDTK